MSRRRPTTVSLPRLTRSAVAYGAALALHDAAELAARLYRFNSLPASPAWRRRVPHERAAARLLGLDAAGDAHRRAVWQVWDAAEPPPHRATCKLYVSPAPAETGAACRLLLAELGRPGGPFSVKVATDPASLLRPDRLIGYFATRAACFATARRLAPRLAGMTPLGVPFTAAIGRSGLLSWGADPPPAMAEALPADERSWRGWITTRVAEALVACASGPGGEMAVTTRLRQAGIDTVRWTPPWR